jgi:hypothetical protein
MDPHTFKVYKPFELAYPKQTNLKAVNIYSRQPEAFDLVGHSILAVIQFPLQVSLTTSRKRKYPFPSCLVFLLYLGYSVRVQYT